MFHLLLERHNPDSVIYTEYLNKDHITSQTILSSLCYTPLRKDRQTDKGNFVRILLGKNKFDSSREEPMWDTCIITITVQDSPPLYGASYCLSNLNGLESSLELVRPIKITKGVYGDFKAPILILHSEQTLYLKSDSTSILLNGQHPFT